MLSSLHIENIAVIKSLDVDFNGGFIVLTGETGAGKSIIIDSLALISGAKSQPQLIRTGETSASISAIFTCIQDNTESKLREMGINISDGELQLDRIIYADGKSTAKINGKSATTAQLRRATSLLISINGQSESLSLKTTDAQLGLLDEYADDAKELAEYTEVYSELTALISEHDETERLSRDGKLAADLLKYQIREIEAAKLKPGEEEELTMQRNRIKSGEKIVKLANFAYRAAYGNEKGASASYLSERAAAAMEQLAEYSKDAAADAEKLRSISIELEDIARRTYESFDLGAQSEEDPAERLEKIEDRLDVIYRVKRKYGGTVEAAIEFKENAVDKLDKIENNDEKLSELNKKIDTVNNTATALASNLTKKRQAAADEMTSRVLTALTSLDMPKVTFDVRFNSNGLGPSGAETAEFYISTNAGEDARPLSLVASGGELSRLMLAIKSVQNNKNGEGTIIYDEIDTGVSGSTSGKIGLKLKESAAVTQIICVTHSAQIAALADTHLFAVKSVFDGRTETAVKTLSGEDKINEIARIIGGINVTDTQRHAARELIEGL